ncbi:MAG: hypothetical protein PHO83_04190 [Geobacteraceae bacterium]|nr:hypothetical protein [Geobacteraceae bacterium]
MKSAILPVLTILLLAVFAPVRAESANPSEATQAAASDRGSGWLENVDSDWGGYLKARGSASWPSSDTLYELVGRGTYLDGSLEGRLKSELFFGDFATFETHYEMVLAGGDTRRKINALARIFPGLAAQGFIGSRIPEDDRRLVDLTSVISENDDLILYHRIDRLALTLKPSWGVVRVGRQAVTWGNGLLFNPMDLFNPFSPTDIERDYKIGDDMVSVQAPLGGSGNLQFLYVPRRNPDTHHLSWESSSLAAKYHFAVAGTEFDLMAARHYSDYLLGLGSVGYLGDAAWRIDLTWTVLDSGGPSSDYLSLVANMDYSWTWLEKNFYGLVEFYYSGIGEDDYRAALLNPDIVERLDRGELYTLGRTYLGASVTMEVHPLVNIILSAITNLHDPSGVLQPRVTYDLTQNMQLIAGGSIFWGSPGSEFGGVKIPGTGFTARGADAGYLWLSWYF